MSQSSRTKKRVGQRRRFTHVEIHRSGRRVFRVSVADDLLDACGAELGALIRKISPGAAAQTASQAAAVAESAVAESEEIIMHSQHNPDDDAYHDRARRALQEIVGSLCDPLLADAIEMAESERARRITTDGN